MTLNTATIEVVSISELEKELVLADKALVVKFCEQPNADYLCDNILLNFFDDVIQSRELSK